MTPHFSFLSKVTRELHLSFPNTKILPALGNHDSHPADFFADPAIDSQDAKKYYSGKEIFHFKEKLFQTFLSRLA
jgi:hypothetical protein